jgi:hypothetical protein
MPRDFKTKKQLNLFVTHAELALLEREVERLSRGSVSRHRVALLAMRLGLPLVGKMDRDQALEEMVRGEKQPAEGQPVT